MDTSLYLEIPGYDVVKDESGSAADLNHGVHLADPIYVYISKDPLPYQPDPVSLSFNSTGGFRIAHFSDLHFGNVAGTCQDVPEAFKQNCSETFSFTFMERALDLLKPDMVIINGDLYANLDKKADDGSYPQLTRGAMQKAIFPIIERGIPFATTWGNHDAEGRYSLLLSQNMLMKQVIYFERSFRCTSVNNRATLAPVDCLNWTVWETTRSIL